MRIWSAPGVDQHQSPEQCGCLKGNQHSHSGTRREPNHKGWPYVQLLQELLHVAGGLLERPVPWWPHNRPMSQDINGDRAIPCMKIGLLIVPESMISGHLVDKNERNSLSLYFIGYRKIACTGHECVTIIKSYSFERLHHW